MPELLPWLPWETSDATVVDAKGNIRRLPAGYKSHWNGRYHVLEREMLTELLPESAGPITWLSIKRNDRAPIHDWRELQRIKNELCGPDREAIEIYPAEDRKVDTSNQFHLWVFPKGLRIPIGYDERLVLGEEMSHHPDPNIAKAVQRPFDPDDPWNAKTPVERDAVLTQRLTDGMGYA
jgi:hypothetical protein